MNWIHTVRLFSGNSFEEGAVGLDADGCKGGILSHLHKTFATQDEGLEEGRGSDALGHKTLLSYHGGHEISAQVKGLALGISRGELGLPNLQSVSRLV